MKLSDWLCHGALGFLIVRSLLIPPQCPQPDTSYWVYIGLIAAMLVHGIWSAWRIEQLQKEIRMSDRVSRLNDSFYESVEEVED